ncbi:hypothetical protein ABID56_000001 [Alkalibacillus flavidus]|uniref:Uncharacterized protein n=1 Tax=Alkalibacillus flavidus TaxID=546021 RepID=A0ABV2KQR5_9BACI
MLNKFKDKFADFSQNGVPIKVTQTMLEELIRYHSSEADINVDIEPGQIRIYGSKEVSKMKIKKNVSFEAVLESVHAEKRMIEFKLTKLKPVDLDFINKKLFNRPPFLQYQDRHVKMDFNSWEIVQSVPVGNIKSFEFKDGEIELKLGM